MRPCRRCVRQESSGPAAYLSRAEHGPVELGPEITDADPYQFEIDGMKPDRELTIDELEALLKTVDGIPEEVEVEDIEIDKDVVSLIDMAKHHPAWM